MSEWKEKSFEDVCFIDSECLPENTDPYYRFFYVSLSDVEKGKILNTVQNISFKDSPSRARRILHNNDVLMATVRPNLQGFAILGNETKNMIGSTGFAVLSEKESNSTEYIYQYLFTDHATRQINNLVAGSNYPAISSTAVKQLKIKIPKSPKEQRKIARILSTVDAMIEKTEAAIAKYKAIKSGMMRDLFTRGIDLKTGKLRPRYEDAPGLYKESELGCGSSGLTNPVPKEWEVVRIDEIASMKSGEGITSKSIFDYAQYPVYGGNGLRGFATTFTHDGDYILIGRQGALCGNVNRVASKFYASEHAVVVSVFAQISVDWLSQLLAVMNLNQYSEASAQPGLAVSKILSLIVKRPQFSEQKEIAKHLLSLDSKANIENKILFKCQQLKAALMSDLLTGKVRVKYNENEKVEAM